ncbi:hypothetical protein B566_EDAN001336 [Ephemera danica]|nr:hypothetical protein B566_EDAN001336 [Ephemera danica]
MFSGCDGEREAEIFTRTLSSAGGARNHKMSSESSEHQRDYRECKKKKLVKQPKLNIFAMGEGPGIETHPTGGARSSSHGIDFERELTMLWTYRAYRSGKEYTVAIEDERTGKFDDFCINIKLDDGTILQQFVQLKHSSQKSPKLTNLDLFPSKSSSKNIFLNSKMNFLDEIA